MKYLFFDLIDTIVKVPEEDEKKNFLKYHNILEGDSYDWLVAGFAQALFAKETGIPFNNLRDYYLTNSFGTIEDMVYAAENISSTNKINLNTIDFTKKYTNFLIDNSKAYPETHNVLSFLKSKGYELYLVSNLMTPYKRIINNLKLSKYFKKTILSCDVGFRKPDKRMFELALNGAKVSANNSIFIGDNWISDVLGSLQLNMDPIYINRKKYSIPNYLMTNGLNGLLEVHQGKARFKEKYKAILSEFIPDDINSIENKIEEHLYKDSNGVIRLRSLYNVKYINDISELIKLLV